MLPESSLMCTVLIDILCSGMCQSRAHTFIIQRHCCCCCWLHFTRRAFVAIHRKMKKTTNKFEFIDKTTFSTASYHSHKSPMRFRN